MIHPFPRCADALSADWLNGVLPVMKLTTWLKVRYSRE